MPDYIKQLNQITQGPDYIGRLNEITGTKPKKTTTKKPKPITAASALKQMDAAGPKQTKPLLPSAMLPRSNTPSAKAAKAPEIADAVDYAQRVSKYKGYFGGSGAAGGASGVSTMLFEKALMSGEIDPNDPALADAWRQVYGTDANIFGKNFLDSASFGAVGALTNLDAKMKTEKYGDRYAQMLQNVNQVTNEENDQHKVAGVAGTIAGAVLPFNTGAKLAETGARGLVGAAGKVVPALGNLGNAALREGTSRVLGNAIAGAGVAGLQSAIAGRNTGEMLTDMGTGAVLGSALPEAATAAGKAIGKGIGKLAPKAAKTASDAATEAFDPNNLKLKRRVRPVNQALGAVDDLAPVAAKIDDTMSATIKPDDIYGVGAMESKFAGDRAVSKARSNTIENTPYLTDEFKAKLPQEDFMYDVVTEKQSMLTAQQRLETDYAGEVEDLISADRAFSGEDVDTAMIAATSMADGGDFDTAVKLIKNVQKAGTKGGQEIQAFAKWSRSTPAGKVLEAQQEIESAVKKLTNTEMKTGKNVSSWKKNALGEKIEQETTDAVNAIKKAVKEAQSQVEKTGLSAEAVQHRYDEILKEKIDNILKGFIKNSKTKQTVMESVNDLVKNGKVDANAVADLIKKKNGLPVLDAADAKQIYELSTQAAQQTDDYMRRVLEARAENVVTDKIPTTMRDKVLGVRRMSMLLNPKTLISRNAGGNAIFNAVDYAKDLPGAAIDKVTSKFTKQRTTSFNPIQDIAASAKGAKKGITELAKDIKLGVDTSTTRHEMLPRTFKSKPMNALDQTLNKMLQAGDRPFYEAAYAKRLKELERLGYDLAGENILANAKEYALDKVFQNNSVLSKKAKELKSSLGIFGDISIPFTQTPANIFDKMIDYSPAGLVKAGYFARKMAKDGAEKLMWNQKKFVDSAARSLTGSGLLALGYALAKKGIVTGKTSTNAKVREADKRAGKQGYSFVVDGQSYTYDWASPVGGLLAAGADMYQAGSKKGDVLNATTAIAAVQGLGNSFFQQSYLDGLSDLFAYGNPAEGLTKSVADLPTSFVPTGLKQAAQSIDPYQRDTYSDSTVQEGFNKILAKIPGLSMTLQPKIGPDGEPVKNFQGRDTAALESALSPGFYAENAQTDAEKEMYRVYQQTGKTTVLPGLGDIGTSKSVTINGEEIKLTPAEWTQYQKDYYSLLNRRVTKIIMDPLYKRLDDTKKASMLGTIQSDVGDEVLAMFAKAKGIKIEEKKTIKDNTKKSRDALRNKALRVD